MSQLPEDPSRADALIAEIKEPVSKRRDPLQATHIHRAK